MKHTLLLLALFFFSTHSLLYAQPPADLPWEPDSICGGILTKGIAAVTCGTVIDIPASQRYTFGLIDLNGALPAAGRIDVTASQAMYHHPSWLIDQIGNVFGITIDNAGNIYLAASSNFSSDYFIYEAVVRYGDIGGGPESVQAAGTIYRIDAITGQASVFAVLPQQAHAFTQTTCEGFSTMNRNTGPGLGNLTYNAATGLFYVTNFEDGRIYRLDSQGNILDSYDPFGYDDGAPGEPELTELVYGIAVSPDNSRLFFGRTGLIDYFGGNSVPPAIYSIDLQPDGSFTGTVNNSNLPAGATWDNYVGTELFHFEDGPTDAFNDVRTPSDLKFTPNGELLVGIRQGCQTTIHTSYNHYGRALLLAPDASDIYSNQLGIIYTSNGALASENAYGGVAWFDNPNGGLEFVFSSADMLSEQGPHGIITIPAYVYGTEYNPAAPAGAIGYVPGYTMADMKGIGGDVEVFDGCPTLCPTAVSVSDLEVCSDEPFNLSFQANGGLPDSLIVSWTDADGNPVNPDNLSINHTDCAPGTYPYYLNLSCAADNTVNFQDTLNVTVYASQLSAFYTTVEEACMVDVLIDGNCADQLQLIGTIPDIQPGDTGTVTLQLVQTAGPGCAEEQIQLSYACPAINCQISGNMPICEGDTLFLAEEGNDATSWQWTSDGAALISDPFAQYPFATNVSDGETFTVIIGNGLGATSSCSFTAEVLPAPAAVAEILNASCQSDTSLLFETGGQAVSWLWVSNGNASFDDPTAQNPTATGVVAGEVFTVFIEDANGCRSQASVTANPIQPIAPDYLIESIDSACWNQDNGAFAISLTSQPAPPYAFSIDGENFQDEGLFQHLPKGEYQILIRDANGCLYPAQASVPGIEPLQLLSETYILPCQGNGVLLSPTLINPSGTEVLWTWPDGSHETSWMAQSPGTISLVLSNVCETLEEQISVESEFDGENIPVYVPNAFSPNGDGLNDCLRPAFSPDVKVAGYTFRIFDRWGNFLFEANELQDCWDGNYRSEPMDPAVFVWYLDATVEYCGQTLHVFKKGGVTLVR